MSLWASYDRDASQIVVGITDDGPGIAPENVETIFGRFKQVGADVRASTQGFGLGLNIANELVQLNFGEILLESEIDKGSTFSFSVPTLDPPRIVERWLTRTDRLQDGATTASLIALRHAPAKTLALMEETSAFIQETVLHRDLILNTAPNSWLLLTLLPKEELGALAMRVEQARLETNRNRVGDELPDLGLERIGTWRLASERDALVANTLAQFDNREGNAPTPQARCLSVAS